MILWKVGYEAKYDELIKENKALFSLDLVKEKLAFAYSLKDEDEMAEAIIDIVNICDATIMSISGVFRICLTITSPGSLRIHDIKYQGK